MKSILIKKPTPNTWNIWSFVFGAYNSAAFFPFLIMIASFYLYFTHSEHSVIRKVVECIAVVLSYALLNTLITNYFINKIVSFHNSVIEKLDEVDFLKEGVLEHDEDFEEYETRKLAYSIEIHSKFDKFYKNIADGIPLAIAVIDLLMRELVCKESDLFFAKQSRDAFGAGSQLG